MYLNQTSILILKKAKCFRKGRGTGEKEEFNVFIRMVRMNVEKVVKFEIEYFAYEKQCTNNFSTAIFCCLWQ